MTLSEGTKTKKADPAQTSMPEPVVKGKTAIRKKTTGEALASSFFASTAKDVFDYVLWEVLVPNLKDVIYDMIDGTALMMLWGNEGRGKRGHSQSSSYNTSYTSYFSGKKEGRKRSARQQSKAEPSPFVGNLYEDDVTYTEDRYGITFENLDRDSVYKLRDALIDWLESYHEVPLDIAKAYAGIPETDISYLDNQVGWYSLRGLTIKKRPIHGRANSFAMEMPPLERLE